MAPSAAHHCANDLYQLLISAKMQNNLIHRIAAILSQTTHQRTD